MHRMPTQGGYAMVAVLLVIAVLLAIVSVGLSQLKTTAETGRMDAVTASAYGEAVSAMNVAWAMAVGANPPLSPLDGCATAEYTEDKAVPFPPELQTTVQGLIWITRSPAICGQPEVLPDALEGKWTPGAGMPQRWYHFRYSWRDAEGETLLSEPYSVQPNDDWPHPAFYPPIDDPVGFSMPPQAIDYTMYVAVTDTADPPATEPPGLYHQIDVVLDTAPCTRPRGYRCLTVDPASAGRPAHDGTNSTSPSYQIVAESVQAGSGLGPPVKRRFSGTITPPSTTISFDTPN